MYKALIATLLATLALAACSHSERSEHSEAQATFRYKINGCDSGPIAVKAKDPIAARDELCAQLKAGSANNTCSEDIQKAEFEQQCPGRSWD